MARVYSLSVSTSSTVGSGSSGCRSAEVLPISHVELRAKPCCCISPGPNCAPRRGLRAY